MLKLPKAPVVSELMNGSMPIPEIRSIVFPFLDQVIVDLPQVDPFDYQGKEDKEQGCKDQL